MKLATLLTCTILLLLITSCNKEQNLKKEGTRLRRIVTTSTLLGGNIDSFFYDSQNRLIEIRKYLAQDYNKRIEYGANGKLFKVTYSYQGADHFSFTFIRNAAGQIIRKVGMSNPGFNYAYDRSYTFNAAGQVLSDTTYYKQTDSVLFYGSNTYDNSGNIIEGNFKDLTSSNQGKTVYVYDSNPNPFFLLGPDIFFVTDDPGYLNRNNVVEMRPWFSPPYRSQLTYQQNGLPVKSMTDYPDSPFGPYKVTAVFEYW